LIESRGFYVSHKEADSVLKKFDKNNDGTINYDEVSTRLKRWFNDERKIITVIPVLVHDADNDSR